MIWDAAKDGDKSILQQRLVAVTAKDLKFEKQDDQWVRQYHAASPNYSAKNATVCT
jgi:hypothetical protein